MRGDASVPVIPIFGRSFVTPTNTVGTTTTSALVMTAVRITALNFTIGTVATRLRTALFGKLGTASSSREVAAGVWCSTIIRTTTLNQFRVNPQLGITRS